jgi:hypothetical protein
MFTFEGVLGYSADDAEEASHFFEHPLGRELSAQEGRCDSAQWPTA